MSVNDFGLKISLPGVDIHSAAAEQCAVHSSYGPLKAKTDQSQPHFATFGVDFTGTVSQGVTHTLYAINHGYGYIPFTIASIVFNDGSQSIVGLGFAGVGANLAIDAFSDTTNFYITLYDNFNWTNANATLQVTYYIFAENGA